VDRTIYDTGIAWGTFVEQSVKTPGFMTKQRLDERLPINPYYWVRIDGKSPRFLTYNGLRTERQARGFVTFRTMVENGSITSSVTGKSIPCPSTASERSLVSNKLLRNIKDMEIDMGVSLGEYRQTAAFVQNTIIKTAKSFNALRRGDASKALRILTGRRNASWRDIPGAASDMWLAYSYGLRPLLADVHAALFLLEKGYQSAPKPIEVKASSFARVGPAFVHSDSGYYHGGAAGYIQTRGSVRFFVDNPIFRTLDQCGLVNPLSVVWELVPYSFVVDWFLPVGQFISGISPPQGVSFVDGWVSTRTRGLARHWTTISSPSPGYNTEAETIETTKARVALSSFPRYHVVVPDVSLVKSQVASAMALLWQSFSGNANVRRRPSN